MLPPLGSHPAGLELTKTVYSAIFKFPFKCHVVMSDEDSDAVKLALGELPLIPAGTGDGGSELSG